MSRAREQDGFTLIELLVSMTLATLIFGATLGALEVFQNNARVDLVRSESQDSARNAIDRLAWDLRNVAAPHHEPELPGSLEQASSTSIVFQTVDSAERPKGSLNATNAMRVRYCLSESGGASPSNEFLWRQVKEWKTAIAPEPPTAKALEACPDETAGDFETLANPEKVNKTLLAEHITNDIGGQKRPVFVYGPPGVSEIALITSVEPTLYLDANSRPAHVNEYRPGEARLTSSIALRNGNRQPTASFTWKQESLKHILLNASASNDPDGLALTYKWSEGGTVFSSTAQVWETEPLSSGTHTITLEVTDPGGLSSKVEQQVKVE